MSYDTTAWDPTRAALEQSGVDLQKQDERAIVEMAADLLAYYKGHQLPRLYDFLAAIFTDPQSLMVQKRLADTTNIVRLIVDRVTTIGRAPVSVQWTDPKDQVLWDKTIATPNQWDILVSTIARRLETVGNVVVLPVWDAEEARVCFCWYTPNNCFVSWAGSRRQYVDRPDMFKLLHHEGEGRAGDGLYQTWDFSQRADGKPARIFEVDSIDHWNAASAKVVTLWEVRDEAGRILVPFVPFRVALPEGSYWADEGMIDLISAQDAVNRYWTDISVTMHYSTHKQMIVEGMTWKDRGGKALRLKVDPTEAIVLPPNPLDPSQTAKVRWDGPASESMIETKLKVIAAKVEAAAALHGISPDALSAKADAVSGISLWLSGEALRDKHRQSKTLFQYPIERVVSVARSVHNWFATGSTQRFSDGGTFTVTIPDLEPVINPTDQLALDEKRIALGIDTKTDLIRRHHPELDEADIKAREAAMAGPAKASRFGSLMTTPPGAGQQVTR